MQVLRGLRRVRGVSEAVLIVTIDRDRPEGILRLLAEIVDFMEVRVYFHAYTLDQVSLEPRNTARYTLRRSTSTFTSTRSATSVVRFVHPGRV